jgi:signal transduction histidine kinase/ligand-binding sensor domain-containing protein
METPVKRMVVWMVMGFCLMGNPFGALGQTRDITLRQYASAQGLSQSTVTTLYLDSRGLLWAGTCSGLNLLLGSSVIRMDQERTSRLQLTDNAIRSINGYGTSRLLVGTEGGAWVFETQNRTLQKIPMEDLKVKDQMIKPFQVGKYLFFVSRENRLLTMDTTTGEKRIVQYSHVEGKQSFTVFQHNAYWLSSKPYQLHRFSGLTGETTIFALPDAPVHEEPSYLSVTSEDEIWITFGKGLVRLNPATGYQEYHTLESLGLSKGTAGSRAIFAVSAPDRSLWVGIRDHGVFRLDERMMLSHSYSDVYDNAGGGIFNLWSPICCVIDRSGNVFVGTDGHGIIKINPAIRKFRHFIPPTHGSDKTPDHFVTAIYKDPTGTLFYSCLNSGLLIAGKDAPDHQQILHVQGKTAKIRRIHFIIPWNQHQLLIGTDLGLTIYAGGNRLIPFRHTSLSLIFTHCCKIAPGHYILGGEDGVFQLKDNIIRKINTGTVNQITLLYHLGNKLVLLAERHDRLYLLDLRNGNRDLTTIHTPNPAIQAKPVYFQAVKSARNVFVATSFGLLALKPDLTMFRHLTTQDGLADQCIYTLKADRHGRIWMATNQGISLLETDTWKFHNFSMDDGLQSMEFNTGASFLAKDGELFFGGVNGINAIYPDQYQPNPELPKIFVTGFRVHDRSLNPDSVAGKLDLRFRHFDNSISFALMANEYTIPERNRIRVRLAGVDEDWISPAAGSEIRYPFLPPGRYTLLASGANNDGLWIKPQTILTFVIDTPFWQQGWFLILMMMCITGMAVLGVHLYYRTQHRKKMVEVRQKQAIEAVRSRIAGEMHDDIGAGLTRIALITEQLIRERVMQLEHNKIQKEMGRLSATSHELIHSLREIVWMTNPEKDNLESLLIFIRKTLNAMTEDTGIEPSCFFPDPVPNLEVEPETRRRLSLLVKECINNAVKHSEADTLSVTFALNHGELFELTISDNGKGMESGVNVHGNGLRNINLHAEALNLNLRFCSQPSSGTQVTLFGPLEILVSGKNIINQNKRNTTNGSTDNHRHRRR